MIKVGDRLPEGSFRVKGDDGAMSQVPVSDLFAGQKVVLVGVPGAFTSTCHNAHIPTFVTNAEAIKAKGVDRIAVMAVNDGHVMKVWAEALGAAGKIDFLADGSVEFTRAIGMDIDRSTAGMGMRCRRFAMIVDDGVVKWLSLEPEGGGGKIVATGASSVLEQL
jgi:glutaredoxin/glutathione-dependent peroxiredoxin